ncbi:MAG: hypothetical protein LBR32_05340 [Propionibacteriaceae bacterium]|nr:hypothetical protein [Propionibacteriaceae bacterium]
MSDQYNPQAAPQGSNDKLMSILSYLGILFIVPLITGDYKKSEVVKFHLNQGIVLFIVAIVGSIVCSIVANIVGFLWWLGSVWSLLILVLVILGIVNAANSKQEPLPVVGTLFTVIK